MTACVATLNTLTEHTRRFLAGFWIRDESVEFDFLGEAFYLMPDGRFVGMQGMTSRQWHFDRDRVYIDAISRCGTCYRGNVTTEYTIKWAGPDELVVTDRDGRARKGIGGTYRRVEIANSLKNRMRRLSESSNELLAYKGRTVLRAIETVEAWSKPRP